MIEQCVSHESYDPGDTFPHLAVKLEGQLAVRHSWKSWLEKRDR